MLLPPTRTLRPALVRGALWRLISHLSLNHLSLTSDSGDADALREILMLYDFADSPTTRKLIDGVLGVSSRRVVGNTREGGRSSFCRGVEMTVVFDDESFHGSGLFLLACVLERFFPLYASINSFTSLIATTNRPEGEVRRWPPRVGEELLV
jgi:type VI secretion system protein ImpG